MAYKDVLRINTVTMIPTKQRRKLCYDYL